MMMVKEIMNEWVKSSGMLGDVQGGFRKGRMIDDDLFMIERLMHLTKSMNDKMFLYFIDVEAYDRVNSVKIMSERMESKWFRTTSGVCQGCHLSPLLVNIYVRELGKKIETFCIEITINTFN